MNLRNSLGDSMGDSMGVPRSESHENSMGVVDSMTSHDEDHSLESWHPDPF